MIRKNVDVIAIAILLFGIVLYSRARETRFVEVVSNKRVAVSQGSLCRAASAIHNLRRIELIH